MTLDCVVKLVEPIEDLVRRRASFNFLKYATPILNSASSWLRGDITSNDIQVVAMGKSGYGKSTTLNALIRECIFETDDIIGCTRRMQSVEFKLPTNDWWSFFSLADLPGLGENQARDAEYFELYKRAVHKAHVILYFLRADHRDYTVDQKAFSELFSEAGVKSKIIIALNGIDKMPPLNRAKPVILTAQHRENIALKVREVSQIFSIPESDVLPISGLEDVNTDNLVGRLEQKLSSFLNIDHKRMMADAISESSRSHGTFGPEGPSQW